MAVRLCVGTVGQSVWFSDDGGESWQRPYIESGLYLEARVWALSDHADEPGKVLAGTDQGLFAWDWATRRWSHLPSPLDTRHIWTIARHPTDPKVIYAGTHPAGVFRSRDGGASFEELPTRFAEQCIFVGKPRVTRLRLDPDDPEVVWAGVEIDGLWRGSDGGRRWDKVSEGLISQDVHDFAILRRGNRRTFFVTTNKGFAVSEDEGQSWCQQVLDSPWQYTRAVAPRADGGRWFLTNGNGPPGSTGRLLASDDLGASWRDVGLPGRLNSTPWCLATNRADPKHIYLATNLGQLFESRDGGDGWRKLDRELGEVRAMLWQPG
jgi:photosystem II stability/assembly factor-like uncharacterized protein